jgi:hypothetical protein
MALHRMLLQVVLVAPLLTPTASLASILAHQARATMAGDPFSSAGSECSAVELISDIVSLVLQRDFCMSHVGPWFVHHGIVRPILSLTVKTRLVCTCACSALATTPLNVHAAR